MQRTIWFGAAVGWALAVALLISSAAFIRISPWRSATLERVIAVGPPRSRAWREIEITLSAWQGARVGAQSELTLRVRRLPVGRSPALQGSWEIAPQAAALPSVDALTLRATGGHVIAAAVGAAEPQPFDAGSISRYLAAAGVKADDRVAQQDVAALARLVTALATAQPSELGAPLAPLAPMREGLALVLRRESRTESSGLSQTQTILAGVTSALIGILPCIWWALRRGTSHG